jgi:GDP-mannose 6-dehydrogenase
MNVAVVGLGPVGIVTATGLARAGHRVHATDRDAARVDALREGRTPVVEPGLPPRVAETAASGQLLAAATVADAVVARGDRPRVRGTPALPTGDADLSTLEAACDMIGPALRRDAPAIVVVRSTVPPGTTRDLVTRRLATASGLDAGRGFHVAVQPEFLREGNALSDYDALPKLVVGAFDPAVADTVVALFAPGPSCLVVRTTPRAPSSPSTRTT